jgi:hypothetical protein
MVKVNRRMRSSNELYKPATQVLKFDLDNIDRDNAKPLTARCENV